MCRHRYEVRQSPALQFASALLNRENRTSIDLNGQDESSDGDEGASVRPGGDTLRWSTLRLLQEGERIEAICPAKASRHPWFLGCAAPIPIAFNVIVAVTDQAVVILEAGDFRDRTAKRVLARLWRHTTIGPLRFSWSPPFKRVVAEGLSEELRMRIYLPRIWLGDLRKAIPDLR